MKRIVRNALGITLIIGVSVSIAVAASAYLMRKAESQEMSRMEAEYGFKQPVRLVNYNSVAAENIDFTIAAENAVHAVVHIKATTKGGRREGEGSISTRLNISLVSATGDINASRSPA